MGTIFDTTKTIVAISTPIGVGGVSIVRMSGKDAIKIASVLFSADGVVPEKFESRKLYLGRFRGEFANDNCLCVVFRAPYSFTGENVVEFQCHGGIKLTQLILEDCLKSGAKLAMNGEFSMRAFLNGKISLSEAEGMIDLINAESDAEVSAGFRLLDGQLSKLVNEYQKKIVDLISDVEVSFDYPEEDIEYITSQKVKKELTIISNNLSGLIDTSSTGLIIKNGINAVIVGKPNVGKSSLLNALIGKDKAIVTDIAGTTRDVVEDAFDINGVKVNIIDTAGIRDAIDVVEKIGVEKSLNSISSADIALFVVDSCAELTNEDKKIYNIVKNKKHIVVVNKIDYSKPEFLENFKNDEICLVSAKSLLGLNDLKQKIYNMVINKNIISNNVIITNVRHKECLKAAKESIDNALKNIDNSSLDLISVDLNSAYVSLGEITGTSSSEEILDSIFSKFCLGK